MRIQTSPEVWFDIPDDPDGGRLLIRHLSPGDSQDIMDKTVKYKHEIKGDETTMKPEIDVKKDREMTLERSIAGWENIYDANGKKLKCTRENILKIARGVSGFVEFVRKCREKLAEDIPKQIEVEEKNFENTQSGSPEKDELTA